MCTRLHTREQKKERHIIQPLICKSIGVRSQEEADAIKSLNVVYALTQT